MHFGSVNEALSLLEDQSWMLLKSKKKSILKKDIVLDFKKTDFWYMYELFEKLILSLI